jgi:hypothetical protein
VWLKRWPNLGCPHPPEDELPENLTHNEKKMFGGKNEETHSRSREDVGKMKKRVLVEKSVLAAAVSRMIRTTPLIREVERGRKKPANMMAPRH